MLNELKNDAGGKVSQEKMLSESGFNVTGKKFLNVIKKTVLYVEYHATVLFGPLSTFKKENTLKWEWMDNNACPLPVGMMDGLQEEIASVHNRLVIIVSPCFFVISKSESV